MPLRSSPLQQPSNGDPQTLEEDQCPTKPTSIISDRRYHVRACQNEGENSKPSEQEQERKLVHRIFVEKIFQSKTMLLSLRTSDEEK